MGSKDTHLASYSDPLPADYQCSECHAAGVKLWLNTCLEDRPGLYCLVCLCMKTAIPFPHEFIDARGYNPLAHASFNNIDQFLPAVPATGGYWTWCGAPTEGQQRWSALPNYVSPRTHSAPAPQIHMRPFCYQDAQPADDYRCGGCNAFGVKLWRPTGYSFSPCDMRCANCVAAIVEGQGMLNPQFDENGFRTSLIRYRGELRTSPYKIDRAGSYVPCGVGEDGSVFTYGTYPPECVQWWRSLPTYPSTISCSVGKDATLRPE
jgi:hypothetical protein